MIPLEIYYPSLPTWVEWVLLSPHLRPRNSIMIPSIFCHHWYKLLLTILHPLSCHLSKTPQKKEISATHHTLLNTKLSELKESLAEDYSLLCCLEVASEKGASSWLTAKPIKEHGFVLHKGAFIDAIHLRYGLTPPRLPPNCVYGSNFIVEHALNCKCGDFPSIRHNELHDITADLLTETSSDVMMEPLLQSLSGEVFKYRTTITDDNARADIAVSNFWFPCLYTFFLWCTCL